MRNATLTVLVIIMQIGGLHTRLEGSRKYLFGSAWYVIAAWQTGSGYTVG